MVKLEMTNKQATVYRYRYTKSRNERWMMRLKTIEAEYYYIEN